MKIKFIPRPLSALLAMGLLTATSLQAATLSWTGTTNGLWSNANWSGGTPVNGGTDTLIFGGSTNLATTNNLTGYTAGGATAITFAANAGAFTLSGSSLSLAGNVTNSSTNLQTIALNMVATATSTFTTSNTSGNITVSGNISGSGGIIKAGSTGTLTLSGSNSFTGGLTLGSGGVLVVTNNNSLGAGAVTFGSLGTLQAAERDVTFGNSGVFTTLSVSGTQGITFAGTLSGFTGGNRTIINNIGDGKTLTFNNVNISEQASTRTLTLSGSGNTTIAGTLASASTGNLTVTNTGLTLLSGTNTYLGVTTASAGTLQFAKTASLYNGNTANWIAGRIAAASGATLAFNVGGTGEFTTGNVSTLLTNLAASSAANNGMNAGSNLGFDTTNASGGSFTISDVIANTTGASGGTRGLTKLGTNQLVLTATNTYTGTTRVSGGTLLVDGAGSINSTATIAVSGSASRLRYTSSVGLSRNVAVTNGAGFGYSSSSNYSGAFSFTNGELSGTNWQGTLGGLTIGANQVISPGNSPGTATTTSQTWANLGAYDWEINQATGGTAGSDPGWDLINLTSDLTISATSDIRFTINVISLGLDNLAGDATGFNAGANYNWLMADSANAIIGFSADKFTINTSEFTNDFAGTFGIALGSDLGIGDNTQLYLTYTVPEPSTYALLALGAIGLIAMRRGKKQVA